MKLIRVNIALIIALWSTTALGQYWQQYVEYEMDVFLNEPEKTLTASSDLLYVNHSPDTLDRMIMHLYHNAFNHGTIAEEVWQDYYGYAFEGEKDWTGIRIQGVHHDSIALAFQIRDDTILEIALNEDLLPGDTLRFDLDWTHNIHEHLDRSGYKGRQFDFAQWYPKFVVYDENGWHDDPFGDSGEFYGEFGKFTVHLDVPASHIIGATGTVLSGDPGWSEVLADTSQEWDEWQPVFKEERTAALDELDSTARRQVSFVAQHVHDFAWNSSPNFVYEHRSWDGIDVHALYDLDRGKKWFKNEARYGVSSLKWLSEKFGGYPYPQVTIVHALLGGGMEYPMLIMDGYHSESLVVHEIGHIWFFGIFGNDELDDAWLDEGFTTFQTDWYLEHHYPNNDYALSRDWVTEFENSHLPRAGFVEQEYKNVIPYVTSPANEPIARHSYHFLHERSYGLNVYERASMILHTLKRYLGEERFLAGMRLYFDRWALKHVNEDRFIKAMEDGAGEELDWLFDQWLHTPTYMDYALSDWKVEKLGSERFSTIVNVENIGGLYAPIPVTLVGANGESVTQRLENFIYRNHQSLSLETTFKPTRAILDKDDIFLDVDRTNNDTKHVYSVRYDFKGWDEYPADRFLYLWKPQIGYNDDEGAGLGLKVKRVYRIPGDHVSLELDYNVVSENADAGLSFSRQQRGLPIDAILNGELGSWRKLNHATLEYELSWAKTFWRDPVHYLTLALDYTDARHVRMIGMQSAEFTRLGLRYEMQDRAFGGSLGFAAHFQYSPEMLGGYHSDFNQTSLMLTWSKWLGSVRVVNRTNLLNNSSATPEAVKYRLATRDLRSIYLDRTGQTMNHTTAIDAIGSHYQLPGGARMRAYTDSMNTAVNYAWSNNFDIVHNPKWLGFGDLGINTFIDVGQYSLDGSNWTMVGDAGIGFSFTPSWKRTSWLTTILRPVTFKFDLPIARIETGEIEVTDVHKHWIFQIAW